MGNVVHVSTAKVLLVAMKVVENDCESNLSMDFLRQRGLIHQGSRLDRLELAVTKIQTDVGHILDWVKNQQATATPPALPLAALTAAADLPAHASPLADPTAAADLPAQADAIPAALVAVQSPGGRGRPRK